MKYWSHFPQKTGQDISFQLSSFLQKVTLKCQIPFSEKKILQTISKWCMLELSLNIQIVQQYTN